jgi:hypothetical protein
MDMEEPTVPVVRKSVKKSGSRPSLSRLAHTSTSTSTSSKYKDKDNVKEIQEQEQRRSA